MSFFRSIWGDYFFSVLVLMVSLGISLGIAWHYQKSTNDLVYAGFSKAAQDRISMIRNQLNYNVKILHSISSLYNSSDSVDAREFHVFAGQLLEDVGFVRGVSWVPVVKGPDRKAFEKSAQSWAPGFQISEVDEHGGLSPAPLRDHYFPITFVEPLRDRKYLGFNYGSEPARASLLERAKTLRQITSSEKVELLSLQEPGVLFAEPIFKTRNEQETLQGYVLSVVSLNDLVSAALTPLTYEGVNIILKDTSAIREEDRILHVHSSRLKKIAESEILEDYYSRRGLSENAIINVGGRQWEVTIQAARGYYSIETPSTSYAIIGAGVVFSTMLFFFMFSRINENDRISRKVSDRTGELQQAKSQMETILFSTKDGIIGMDRSEKITFCNPMAASILGYFKRDIMGASFQKLIVPSTEDGEKSEETGNALRKVLESGDSITISDQLFWKRDGTSIEVEYTLSPILGDNDIDGLVLTFRDISERRQMERKLEQMARFDQLTGLANRAAFLDQLKMAIARSKRTAKKVGIIYIDLNNFKPINDTLGHAAGDIMLKGFADRLRKSCRDYDYPARLGGDEFIVMVDNLDAKDGAIRMAERLIENLREPFKIYDKTYQMSGSMGLAFFPDDAAGHDELITHADSAMYKAKKDKSLSYALYEKP